MSLLGIIGSGNKKISSVLSYNVWLKPWMQVGVRASLTDTRTDFTSAKISGTSTSAAIFVSPLLTTGDEWNLYGDDESSGGAIFNNPYIVAKHATQWLRRNTIVFAPWLNADIIKGLKLKVKFSYARNNTWNFSYSPSYLPTAAYNKLGGTAARGAYLKQTLINENTLNYNTKIKKSSIEAVLGLSVEYNEADGERALVKDTVSGIPGDGFTLIASYAKDGTAADMKAKSESDGGGVLLRALSPITVDKSKGAQALLYSSSAAVLHRAGATVDTAGSYPLAAISTYENRDGSESKLFLSAGIYLTSSDNMITEGYSNKSFLYSLFDVFFEKGNMPYGCRSVVYENTLLENLTMGTATAFTAAMLAIPVLLAAVGTVVLVRRRNR